MFGGGGGGGLGVVGCCLNFMSHGGLGKVPSMLFPIS